MTEEHGTAAIGRSGAALLTPRVGVVKDNDGKLIAATSGAIEGVLETAATAAGEVVYWFPIAEAETVFVSAGGTCTDGGPAMVTTGGQFVDRTGTNTVVGRFLTGTTTLGDRVLLKPYARGQQEQAGSVATTATAIAATLTDSTGQSGTHDDTLAATTVPTITATNPAAPAAYSAHASGAVAVLSNAATDLDTTAAALAALRASVATYETAISALVVDVAAILTLLTVMTQNQSDTAQKVIELVAQYNQLRSDIAT